ncbi:MAG TPA: glycosyltransferase family 1 protein [Burkholderiales bacterium]|nr:glycosyltransferase family 1 protein [Burkholderiales bacterium]
MRVGIDIRLAHWPGIGRYVEESVRRLVEDYPQTTYVLIDNPRERKAVTRQGYHNPGLREGIRAANCTVVEFEPPPFSVREPFALGRLADECRLDVMHSPYINVPLGTRVPLVATLHDFRHPDTAASWRSPRSVAKRAYYEAMLRVTMQQARATICVSEFLKREIVRFRPAAACKTIVIGHGVGESFHPMASAGVSTTVHDDARAPYLLFVGTMKPHKNLCMTLEAFAQARGSLPPGYRLIVAAADDPRYPKPRATARALGLDDVVRFVGHVDKQRLAGLYNAARATVLPSTYESFGLPVLESMACGTPVIAARCAALPEVGGDAAYYVEPDAYSLAQAMCRLARDDALHAALRERGLARARSRPWSAAARKIHDIYGDVACGGRAS